MRTDRGIPRSGGNRAFSLIEVTLAMAIFGLAVVVLTQAFVNGLIGLEATEEATSSSGEIRFVRSQVIRIADLDEFEEGGEVELLDEALARWEADVEPTQVIDHRYAHDLLVLGHQDFC